MDEKEFDYINVIPLVDIMLVLLTIVLVTATFIVQGSIPVKLPVSKTQNSKNIRSYNLTITEKEEIFFEGKRVSLSELGELFKALDKEAQVSVFADRASRVQTLVSVLDLLKKYEINRVYIKTQLER